MKYYNIRIVEANFIEEAAAKLIDQDIIEDDICDKMLTKEELRDAFGLSIDYLETHFEIVAFITRHLEGYDEHRDEEDAIFYTQETLGMGGLWELAKFWVDEFDEKYEGVVWGEELEYFDTLEAFLLNKIK